MKSDKLAILKNFLCGYYPADYSICLYEAPALPTIHPRIEWIPLSNLDQSEINSITTVYIPLLEIKTMNRTYLILRQILF